MTQHNNQPTHTSILKLLGSAAHLAYTWGKLGGSQLLNLCKKTSPKKQPKPKKAPQQKTKKQGGNNKINDKHYEQPDARLCRNAPSKSPTTSTALSTAASPIDWFLDAPDSDLQQGASTLASRPQQEQNIMWLKLAAALLSASLENPQLMVSAIKTFATFLRYYQAALPQNHRRPQPLSGAYYAQLNTASGNPTDAHFILSDNGSILWIIDPLIHNEQPDMLPATFPQHSTCGSPSK
jgi:hypothetical protein